MILFSNFRYQIDRTRTKSTVHVQFILDVHVPRATKSTVHVPKNKNGFEKIQKNKIKKNEVVGVRTPIPQLVLRFFHFKLQPLIFKSMMATTYNRTRTIYFGCTVIPSLLVS